MTAHVQARHASKVLLRRLRVWLRTSEAALILLATLVGGTAGLLTVAQAVIARTLQSWLYPSASGEHLSSATALGLPALLALPLGGLALAAFNLITGARRRRLVDAVEANALHGGRMSTTDSLVVSGQTMISNGFGASVGLEAAYAQLGGAMGSLGSETFKLRRADARILLGAGAGAAIAAAFGAPLAGAFYAFEIVIGAYTPAAIAPVAAASLAGVLVARALGQHPYLIDAAPHADVLAQQYLPYAALGAVCALLGIALMRTVAVVERASRVSGVPDWSRPALGGALLVPIAMVSPQALSAGHGALNLDLAAGVSLGVLLLVLVAKSTASAISLGFGFRGGLFFASLFLGTLTGQIFAAVVSPLGEFAAIDARGAAMVGMAAFAVAVVGGPMTMALLVLEITHDFALTGAVLAASLVASSIVRETFGYSFSTWRLHLRGEAIRSARDVGWVETMTARALMREERQATPAMTTIDRFRQVFPLGATSHVVLADEEGSYAGIVFVPSAYVEGLDPAAPVQSLATADDTVLTPEMNIAAIMRAFDQAHVDELAVVSADRRALGIVSESYVHRRYAKALEEAQKDLFGER